jgi:hypothetical protein
MLKQLFCYSSYVIQTKIPDRIRNPDKMPDNDVIMGLALLSYTVLRRQNLELLYLRC